MESKSDVIREEYRYEFVGALDDDGEIVLTPQTPESEQLAETLRGIEE